MFKVQGIAVDSFVAFSTDCAIRAQAFREEIQIELGHAAGSLHVVTDVQGLAMLVAVGSELLDRVHAVAPGAPVDVQVPDRPTTGRETLTGS